MHGKLTKIIGLMSGTSLDGLDIVCVEFKRGTELTFDIVASETIAYSSDWESRLKNGILQNKEQLRVLDKDYGVLLAEFVLKFVADHSITEIDFIASHGHTIFHKPEKGYTLQVGSGSQLSRLTKCKVICDFRTQDVQLGGQGAPLVPLGDELLFSAYDACLNLGGFANVSYKDAGKRVAFDICPVNIVLNYYVKQLGYDYDDKGKIASEGEVHGELLKKLNELPYYKMRYPKSLGLEWVQENVFPIINSFDLLIKDVLRTFIEHIAMQMAASLSGLSLVLVTGGGAFNTFLMNRISEETNAEISTPSNEIINYKEALIFAFLGLLRADNQVNCLSSVTGAKKDHSSGVIFVP